MMNEIQKQKFLLKLLLVLMVIFTYSHGIYANKIVREAKPNPKNYDNCSNSAAPVLPPCTLNRTRLVDNINYCPDNFLTSLTISVTGNQGSYYHHRVIGQPVLTERCDGTATLTGRWCGVSSSGNIVTNACWDVTLTLSNLSFNNPGYGTNCAGNVNAGWYHYANSTIILNGVSGGIYNGAQVQMIGSVGAGVFQFGNGAAHHYERNGWEFGAGIWGDIIVNNPGTNNIQDNGGGDLQISLSPSIMSCSGGLLNNPSFEPSSYTSNVTQSPPNGWIGGTLQSYINPLFYVGDGYGFAYVSNTSPKMYQDVIAASGDIFTLNFYSAVYAALGQTVTLQFYNGATALGTPVTHTITQVLGPSMGGPYTLVTINAPAGTTKVRVCVNAITGQGTNGNAYVDAMCLTKTCSVNASINGGTTLCAGQTKTLTANPTSGTAPYTYKWQNNSTSQSININTGGTYSVTITDAVACTGVATITINSVPLPVAVASNNGPLGCNKEVITLTASGGGTYLWSTGANTATTTVTSSGTYTVTVTSSSGCTSSASTTVTGSILLKNGSFENGMTNWTGSGGTSVVSGQNPQCGTFVANIPANSSISQIYTPLTTGCVYTISFKARTTIGVGDVSIITYNASGTQIDIVQDWISSTTWKDFSYNITANPGATQLQFFIATAAANANIYIDCVCITSNCIQNCQANAVNDSKNLCKDNQLVFNVGSNDTYPPGATNIRYNVITYFTSGSGSLSSAGLLTFNPNAGFLGQVFLNYELCYTINGNTCCDAATVDINVGDIPVANAGADFTKTCTSNFNGKQIGSAPVSGHTYAWSPATGLSSTAIANPIANPSSSTTYTLTVTNLASGCTGTDQVVATVNIIPLIVDAGANFTLCRGASSTICASGGATYLWSDGSTSKCHSINPNSTRTYTVTATDLNGCTATDFIVVTVVNCGTCNDKLLEFGGDGECNDGPDNFDPRNISTCVKAPTVFGPPDNGPASCSQGVICMKTTMNYWDFSYTSVGQTTLSYIQSNFLYPIELGTAGGSSNSSSCPKTFSYTVKFYVNNTLVYTYTGTVSADIWTTVKITPPTAINLNNNDILKVRVDGLPSSSSCQLFETGGLSVYGCCIACQSNFADAGADFTKTCVTNPNGKQIGSANVSGKTYQWLPITGLNSWTISNPLANPSSNTTYTVTVTDIASGCTDTDVVIVTVNTTMPVANAGADFTKTCTTNPNGAPVGTTTTAGWTYAWSPAAGLSSTAVSNPTANPTSTTTYTVTVTNTNNGCTATDAVLVTVNADLPVANAGADFTKTCVTNLNGLGIGSATVLGMTYVWSPAAGLSSTTVSNPTANPIATTTYTVTVTNTNNGCAATDAVLVTVNTTVPVANAGADFTKTCASNPNGTGIGSANVSGMAYSWSPSAGLSSTTVSNPTANPTTTTTYTVTVTNTSNGCTATDAVIVTVNNTVPIAIAGLDFTKTCTSNTNGGQIGTTTTPGWTYSWSPAAGLNSTTIANPIANPTTTTTYSVTVTNTSNGCFAIDAVTVTVNTSVPSANAGADVLINCSQNSNGVLIGSNAVTGLSYLWSPSTGLNSASIANPTANPTATTTYTLTVTNNANGCTATDAVVVNVNKAAPTADAGPDKSFCSGNAGQLIGTAAVNGMAYSWSPTSGLNSSIFAQPTATPSTTTTYTLIVTNTSNGCTSSDVVTVTVNPKPVSGISAPVTICATEDAFFQVSPAVAGATYAWNFDGGTPFTSTASSVSVAWPTTYIGTTRNVSLTVTNSNGCQSVYNHAINVTQNPIANAGPDKEICEGASTTIGGSPSGPAGSSFLWTPNLYLNSTTVANPTATPPVSITYTLTTTINGCAKTDQVVVTVNTNLNPTVSATATPTQICAGKTSALLAVGNANGGQGAPFQYVWNNSLGSGASKNTPILNTTTSYTVTVIDRAQCTATNIVSVNVVNCGSIGDYVWVDTDGDGIQDISETGINGVSVLLKDVSGTVIASKITSTGGPNNTPGYYIFSDLMPSQYTIMFMAPAGYNITKNDSPSSNDNNDSDANPITGNTPVINLVAGQNVTNVDAGLYQPASLGNYVWEDLNKNGSQDAGEPGINGVTVLLKNSSGTTLQTTVTATNAGTAGYHQFSNLTPGDYIVMFMAPTGYKVTTKDAVADGIDSDADPITGSTAVTNLTSGESDQTIDAGLYRPATIGDYVWRDTDGDGIQDPNETGVNGVTVLLKDATGTTVLQTTVTSNGPNGAGYYQFSPDPGTYVVMFMAPAGNTLSPSGAPGSNANNDSNPNPLTGNSTPITVTSGSTNNTIDAGLFQPASLGNYVWEDLNKNGSQDAGEPGINGVTVLLKNSAGTTLQTTVTATNAGTAGYYQFSNLTPGDYIVMFMAPTGYNVTTKDAVADGTDSDADPITGNTAVTNLTSGESDQTIDAGLYRPATIGDYVWRDTDGDGIQDPNETGVNGVTVLLKDATGTTVLQTTVTSNGPNGAGYYQFSADPSTYVVMFMAPAGNTLSPSGAPGSNANNDSNPNPLTGNSTPITVTSGSTNNTVDAGLYQPASLGNYVWEDLNKNGSQDAGEPGINGVTVLLKNSAGTTLQTTVTATNAGTAGYYQFSNLIPGDYIVMFMAPTGYNVTTKDAVADGTDSDADPITGSTAVTNLTSGESDQTIDAGLYRPATIGDYVWRDTDGDGIQDPNETGVNGVTVLLKDATGTTVLQTTVTINGPNGAGYYQFSADPGTYVVMFMAPAGNTLSPSGAPGSNANNDSNPNPLTGNSTPITVTSGSTNNTIDAGLYQTASLGNYVWFDTNHDGKQDAGEPGINGFTVNLYNAATNTLVGTKVTAPNPNGNQDGYYEFTNLAPGNYYIQVIPTAGLGYTSTTPNNIPVATEATDSDINGLHGVNTSTDVNLVSGQNYPDLDAGYYLNNSIGNYVWLDVNRNGIQDPAEVGINGVTVQLFSSTGNLVGTKITTGVPGNGNPGWYLFENLLPGNYYVKFTVPDGYYATNPNNTSDNADSDITGTNGIGTTDIINLTANTNNLDIDGGIFRAVKIGNFVWNDTGADNSGKNAQSFNGLQDPGEHPQVGMSVFLHNASGAVVQSTVTDNKGEYCFFVTPNSGSYYVEFKLPTDFSFTTPNVSANGFDNLDSDVTETFGVGTTALFNVGNVDNLTIDAGIYLTILPLELIYFDAQINGKNVEVDWTTVNEKNVNKIELQRRHESEANFKLIETKQAVNNPVTVNQYSYIDQNLTKPGVYHYRLRIIENNGVAQFSYVKTVTFNPKSNDLHVSLVPNPAHDYLDISIASSELQKAKIELIDITGKVIFRQSEIFKTNNSIQKVRIDVAEIKSGIYFVRVNSNNKSLTEKITITH